MANILGYTELTFNSNIDYSIGALLKDDNSYTMPWLQFTKNKGSSTEEELDCWDNEDYLVNELYTKILKPWIEEKKVHYPEDFKDIIVEKLIDIKDFEGLYKLFNKAFELKLLKYEPM